MTEILINIGIGVGCVTLAIIAFLVLGLLTTLIMKDRVDIESIVCNGVIALVHIVVILGIFGILYVIGSSVTGRAFWI